MPCKELGIVIKKFNQDLPNFTILTKSTRRATAIYIYIYIYIYYIFKLYFSNYNGRTI